MMKATDFANRDDVAEFRPLNWSTVGCVLVERQMSAGPMIVREVRGQDASQMPLGENDDMVQALASHRANEPLREGILPGTARGRDDFTDPHAFDALTKRVPVGKTSDGIYRIPYGDGTHIRVSNDHRTHNPPV